MVVGYLLLVSWGDAGLWPVMAQHDWFGLTFALAGARRRAGGGGDVASRADGAGHSAGAGGYQANRPPERWAPGAGVFLTITLPLTLPGIIVGAVLAFRPFAANLARPLPLFPNIRAKPHTFRHVYPLIQTPERGSAAARLYVISVYC